MIAPSAHVRRDVKLDVGRLRKSAEIGFREGVAIIRQRADQQFRLAVGGSRKGSGLREKVSVGPAGLQATIGTPRFDAHWLEGGTRAHPISGRLREHGRRVMKFTVGGQTLFRPHVKHPGQRATFWFTRGVRAGIPAAQAQIERRIREGLGG